MRTREEVGGGDDGVDAWAADPVEAGDAVDDRLENKLALLIKV